MSVVHMEKDGTGRPTGRRLPINGRTQDPMPEALVCDHDAEGRATLELHLGMQTIAAYKAINEGIQAVQSRLQSQPRGDGSKRPTMFFVIGGRIHEQDQELVAKKVPTSTEEEFDGYVWDIANNRKKREKGEMGELPVDANNHGMDTVRYGVTYVDKTKQGMGSWGENPNILEWLRANV